MFPVHLNSLALLSNITPWSRGGEVITSGWLLADEPLYSQMGARFRDNSGSSQLVQLVWLVVPCLLIILAIWLVHRMLERQKQLERTSPRFLFFSLCKVHQLTRAERAQLWKHARRLELENPAAVFVTVEAFSEAALAAAELEQREQLQAIGQRLLGSHLLKPNANSTTS